jgi:hypothetical protein
MHVTGAVQLVNSDVERRLGATEGGTRTRTARSKASIARGTVIQVVPESADCEFNPPQVAFAWLEDFHCAEFRFRARPKAAGVANAGRVSVRVAFYVAPILIADITFTIGTARAASRSAAFTSTTVQPYQRVFVSYSHADSAIADQLEKAYRALGMDYLRDIRMLRSGQKWAPVLLQRISESEIFQLLWSEAARSSNYVRQEWEHALRLKRPYFIRPLYWQEPMPPPPEPLAHLHFAYLELRENQHL